MKLTNTSFITICLLVCITTISCKRTYNSDLDSLNLIKGDILLCGGGDFGDVSFALSCSYETRSNFNLAISLLHSFEYEEAEKAFAKVIDIDPNCAMAYWGVAMCNFHALWRPPTKVDLKKGSLAIKIARSLEDKTEREVKYIEAIAHFYTDWETVDHQTRIKRFENAMETIYNSFPDDKEAAIFYALALNSGADLSDKTYANRRRAGAILEKLFPDQPNHPGITHYIIHSYDYPELAKMALSPARRYASIAPASSHAQHMPSHIFTRLGLWEESIQSNLSATSSAQCYAEQVEMEGHWDEEIHGTDYLVYAYLQLGKIQEAKNLLDYLVSIDKINPIGVKGAYPSAAIPSRFYLETRDWEKASNLTMPTNDYPSQKFPWANAIIHYTRVLGAVNINNLDLAHTAFKKLNFCHDILIKNGNEYMANQVLIMVKSADAWIHFNEGKNEEALALMKESADIESKTEKQSLTPGEVLPSQELLGDLLLKLNKPTEALKAYALNLNIRPNRFNGLYGAAIAARLSGNKEKAKDYFNQLIELTKNSNSNRPELEDAKRFVNETSI
ncbi:MAG: tetratricopeptide repeat protein [Psychroserpens sp.]|uniref:tetratricopeptide repeat protein n=1 Tax=Psychroserpens sp. TaxID=2020870 RepID=UPI00300107C4